MFGDPLRAMLNDPSRNSTLSNTSNPSSSSVSSPPSEETLKLIEGVLDYIRSNLNNIIRTFGVDSPQHKSAVEIMNQYLDENMKRLNVEKDDISEMLGKMSLSHDSSSGGGDNDDDSSMTES